MLDIIFGSFNLFTPIFIGIGSALGILIGLWLSKPKKNQVCKLIPEDARGYDLDVVEENANFIYCDPIETLPPQRFLKFRKGFTVTQKRRWGRFLKINRYFGREGTAFTQRIEQGKITDIPLNQTMIGLWGEDEYNNMPEHLREAIEQAKIGVTVSIEDDPKTPHDWKGKPISEENIKIEEDKQAAETFWKGKKASLTESFIHNFAWMGFGGLIVMFACILLGWIPIGGSPTV